MGLKNLKNFYTLKLETLKREYLFSFYQIEFSFQIVNGLKKFWKINS